MSSEGYGFAPQLSRDGQTLYYLQAKRGTVHSSADRGAHAEGMQLIRCDLRTGTSEPLLPGVAMWEFQVSADGKKVLYSARDERGRSHLWSASTDRRYPPQQVSSGDDDGPNLLPDGDIIFRSQEQGAYYIYRMKPDGSQRRKLFPMSVIRLNGVSPDGQWITVWVSATGEESSIATQAYRVADGKMVRVCNFCLPRWSASGKYFYLALDLNPETQGKMYALPLRAGSTLPDLPPGGVTTEAELKSLSGTALPVKNAADFAAGLSPASYAFAVETIQRNLYRIPLP